MSADTEMEIVMCRRDEINRWLTDPISSLRWKTAGILCGCPICESDGHKNQADHD